MKLIAALLLAWGPLQLALRVSAGLSALSLRGWPLGVFLIAHVLVTALGFAAGRALLDRQPNALRLAIAAFVLIAALDIVYYGTTIFPSSLAPGDAPIYLAVSLAIDVASILYLGWRSYR